MVDQEPSTEKQTLHVMGEIVRRQVKRLFQGITVAVAGNHSIDVGLNNCVQVHSNLKSVDLG